MVAWRSLIQGLLIETLPFGFAIWGQDSTADWKGPVRDPQGQCELKRSFWEAEARNCTSRLSSSRLIGSNCVGCRSVVSVRLSCWGLPAEHLQFSGPLVWS